MNPPQDLLEDAYASLVALAGGVLSLEGTDNSKERQAQSQYLANIRLRSLWKEALRRKADLFAREPEGSKRLFPLSIVILTVAEMAMWPYGTHLDVATLEQLRSPSVSAESADSCTAL